MEHVASNRSGELSMLAPPLAAAAATTTMTPTTPTASQFEHCHLFLFVVDAVLTGCLCLCGLAGNTISFMTLWQDKAACVTTFLLQAIIVCDLAVLWMTFLGDCVPGLRWALRILDDCHRLCGYVSSVTRPLRHMAQTCAVLLTLAALVDRYLTMSRHGQAKTHGSPSAARRCVIAVVFAAMVVTLPQTVERHVYVGADDGNGTASRRLSDLYWYRLLYHNIVGLQLVYVIPLALQFVLVLRLACVVHSVNRLRSSLATSFRLHQMDITQLVLTLSVTMLICYVPLVVERALLWIQGHPAIQCATLVYYLHSFSRLFVALNSSMKIVLLSLFVGDFKAKLNEVLICSGSPSKDDQAALYQCPDMSEMTLISNVDSRT